MLPWCRVGSLFVQPSPSPFCRGQEAKSHLANVCCEPVHTLGCMRRYVLRGIYSHTNRCHDAVLRGPEGVPFWLWLCGGTALYTTMQGAEPRAERMHTRCSLQQYDDNICT